MSSFPFALKNVFGGMTSQDASFPAKMARSWPLLRLAHPTAASRSTENLALVVEREIIPRLMRAHPLFPAIQEAPIDRDPPTDLEPGEEGEANAETAEAFARMVLTRGTDVLMAFIATLIQGGVSVHGGDHRPRAAAATGPWP
jgi:hypothetical protein